MAPATLLVHDDPDTGEVEVSLLGRGGIELVRHHVGSLDGRLRTLVTIYADGSHLAVGGGGAPGCVVYATSDDDTFFQLVDGEQPRDELVEVVAGGQPARYPRRQVVALDIAQRAAEAFALTGELDAGLTWEAA